MKLGPGYFCCCQGMRASNSSSGVSVEQSVGSNPGRDTCVHEQDICMYIFMFEPSTLG